MDLWEPEDGDVAAGPPQDATGIDGRLVFIMGVNEDCLKPKSKLRA